MVDDAVAQRRRGVLVHFMAASNGRDVDGLMACMAQDCAERHHVLVDTGLSEWRFVGTDKSDKTVDVQGCDIFRFDGDLIALKDSYRKARSV